MTDNQRGFTLIELLAVVVIIGVIATIASTSTMGMIRHSREQTASDMRESLKDAAVTYSLENMRLKKCSVAFSKEVYENKNISNLPANTTCAKYVDVKTLKEKGFFEDKKKYCDDAEKVLVYRYTDIEGSEYKAFVSDNACKK